MSVRKQAQYDEMKAAAEADQHATKPYPILLDVTQDEHIPTAMEQLKSYLQKHDKDLIALVNNAGINPEIDKRTENRQKGQTPENTLVEASVGSRVFETNVIGVGRVTKACIPFLVKGGTGRVVNIGSYFGSIAGALGLGHCYYEASKVILIFPIKLNNSFSYESLVQLLIFIVDYQVCIGRHDRQHASLAQEGRHLSCSNQTREYYNRYEQSGW